MRQMRPQKREMLDVRSDHEVPGGGSYSDVSKNLRIVLLVVPHVKNVSARTTIDLCKAEVVVRKRRQTYQRLSHLGS